MKTFYNTDLEIEHGMYEITQVTIRTYDKELHDAIIKAIELLDQSESTK